MQKNNFLLINNIIYQVYSISDFKNMKETFLNLLRVLIPNTCASILMADHTDSSHLLTDPVCVPASYIDVENNYLSLEDDDLTRWLMMARQSMLIRESDLTPEQKLIETPIYQKCYEPFGLHYSAQLYLVHKETFLGVVTLYRSKEQGDFTDDELFLLNAFSDHLNLRFYNEYHHKTQQSNNSSHIIELVLQYHLTNRESEILQLIFDGLDNEKIADQLCISNFTLKKHIQNLYNKLGVSSRWDLLRFKK